MNFLSSKSKHLSYLRLPLSSPYRILCISLFTSSSSSSSSNSLSSSHNSYSSSSRRYDEESRNVRVSVWWDIENCAIPSGVNAFKIVSSISAAVRANGIKGPVQITAFGDVFCLTRSNQEALSSTGINLIHIPHGGRNSADRSLLVDLMYWVSQNPPPAHIFLISGDRDFAGILHRLRMNNYNILIAGSAREGNQIPGVLCSAASIMWYWNELAKGQNLFGRHFNQPPDGPFNSWYGHYRGQLEDPYEGSEPDDSTNAELSSNPKPRPVPRAVLKQIRQIVDSYPEGVPISVFPALLKANKVAIDKNFYGHGKFSAFLLSIPKILRVESAPNGQFFLYPISPKVQEPEESNDNSSGSMSENGNREVQATTKENGETPLITKMVDVEPQLPMSSHDDVKQSTVEVKVDETPGKRALDDGPRVDQIDSENEFHAKESLDAQVVENPLVDKTTSTQCNPASGCPLVHTEEQSSKSEIGFLERLRTIWFGSSDVPDKFHTSSNDPEKVISEEGHTKLTNQDEICGAEKSTSEKVPIELDLDAKSDKNDVSIASQGFLGKVISWFRSWRNESPINTLIEEPSLMEDSRKHEEAPQVKKHELFSKDMFWKAFESFLKTSTGSDIVVNSTSREDLSRRLQKDGPLVLRPLQESDVLHLVDLLVSDKKWIKEFPTKTPRFRIVLAPRKNSTSTQPQNSKGLSSIFLGPSSDKDSEPGLSSVAQKPSEKSRGEILADCQKLLDKLLQKYPEGFNIGAFKKLFIEKYGYSLDYQKLGYPKMVSLLQIMPGVKIESSKVYADNVVFAPGIGSLGSKEKWTSSDSEMSDSQRKDEDIESPWEELGPVDNSNTKQETKSGLGRSNGVYEPPVSDDEEFSEPEEDEISSSRKKVDGQSRSRVNEEDSSLMQILNTWYSAKDEHNPKDNVLNVEGLVDCFKEETKSFGSSHIGVKDDSTSPVSQGRKKKVQKSYTFVSDSPGSKKDKLIDGILGSLKNSRESRMQG